MLFWLTALFQIQMAINMLTILSEKISNIMELNIAMENEILLQENSNNGC